jgi:hypothetical protein
MKYLLLFCNTAEDIAAYEAKSQAELDKQSDEVQNWLATYASKVGGRGQLHAPDTATTVRFVGDGASIVTDGPFLEGKEEVGGYCEIDVADLDEALRMAKSWPASGAVEIRPVVQR